MCKQVCHDFDQEIKFILGQRLDYEFSVFSKEEKAATFACAFPGFEDPVVIFDEVETFEKIILI